MEDDPEDWRTFHDRTREYVIFLLLFISLYCGSYCLIAVFKKRMDYYSSSYEDAVVYRISLWMSAFSLGISIGAALLLPISIISNEVLLYYPRSYYVQWLNSSLIHGLWNLVFLFSNVALFIFLPFAHFFIESEGFPGLKKGIMARVYESVLVLMLLGMVIMGITCIISAIFDYDRYNFESIFNVSSYYLPFLYSCVSFLGVLMLLLCTPVGFARLFTVMSEFHMKPKTEFHTFGPCGDVKKFTSVSYMQRPVKKTAKELIPGNRFLYSEGVNCLLRNSSNKKIMEDNLHNVIVTHEREKDNFIPTTPFERTRGYPFVMLLILILTTLSVLMVIQNTLELCFGIKSLPIYSQNLSLGISSLSSLGPVGAALEIVLILYLWCTSIVGLYSLPFFYRLRPKRHCTSMTQVIGNCAVLLIISSALPVLARSLGITNFDLLGDFGRINWLGSFYVVLFQNVVFVAAAAICLGTKITATVRREIYDKLCDFTRASEFRTYEQRAAQL